MIEYLAGVLTGALIISIIIATFPPKSDCTYSDPDSRDNLPSKEDE